jgi:uncharacterized membrane protein
MMKSQKTVAVIFGSFFILAFAAYGTGSGIMETVTTLPETYSDLEASNRKVIISGLLMALLHTILNIGLAVIMVPILKKYNRTMAVGYLSAAIASTVMLIVGALFLFLLVPLSEEYLANGQHSKDNFQTMFMLLKKGNFYAYQIAMVLWGLGGLMFTTLLYKSFIVPRPIAVWGFLGYIVFIYGAVAELCGLPIGLLCDIPGGLFELSVSVFLIAKGFYASHQERHEFFPNVNQL